MVFAISQKKKLLQPRKSWHASPIEEKKNGKPTTKKKNLWEVGWIKRVRIRSMIPLLLRLTRSKLAAGHWERGTLRGKESMVW